MHFYHKKLKSIKGDASFRKFFRKSKKNFTSIIITAKKEKKKNLLIYDAINKVLIKNKIFAPKLYNEEFTNNFIEVEDLGKNTLYDILKKKNSNKSNLFKKIINVLNQIQSIKDKKIKNFKNKYYIIPTYSKKILFKETSLFCEWYVERELPKKFKVKFKKKFNNPVTLENIKKNASLKGLALIKQSRLSVMPIDTKCWKIILKMGNIN